MTSFKHCSLQLAIATFCIVLASAYDYEEIRKWNASCFPKDTCSVPRDLDDTDYHNCDCSSLCVLYDTCCIDSPFLNISNKYERTASCRSAGQSGEYIFMLDTCPDSYDGPQAMRRRCEQNAKNWSDPFNNVPVTHPLSQKTYKSLFCAICNGENPKELIMWQVMLDCSALKGNMNICLEDRNFVLSNMMYIHEKGLWGIWSYDPESDWMFRYLSINYKMPESIKKFTKECRPNLISDCHSNWRNRNTRQMCKSYMGVIYFQNETYRNAHCALCNYETNMTGMSCHETMTSPFKGPPPMNFNVLLDIDLSDGEKVGTIEKKCEVDQVYDPFSKKCRTIECPIPGYKLQNGKCVHE
ncbi:uncharacterized protein TNCV_1017391 [Trichonephila clavipes]|uniref:SMB domain-containing protein n=1 Tax=Trichonephila clavipes TaxID=2585209 RepID=A0A8X7BAA7_TRICX|nr:uncharacterized protein TNCV_1017391 [Trichonephila clavipes]